ncbi:DoxX family protein [Pseudokineococcus sp. 1T1Z-3]|uniref:DoxX family protein n=1 Tax=Pseudokineococcus sp. 1T1Z-3 TaxID=3132745 RepID=UPI00309BAD25
MASRRSPQAGEVAGTSGEVAGTSGEGRVRASALRMAAALTATGTLHLVRPGVFDVVVPRSLGAPRPWVLASGVAELVCAAALAVPRTRRLGGVLTTALLLAVWPGNLAMARAADRSARASRARRVLTAARVPLQLPMVGAAVDVVRGRS